MILNVQKERNVQMPTHGDFKLASRTRFNLPTNIFYGGPWIHLATVNRSINEYVAIQNEKTGDVYLEQISGTGHFHHISDEKLWEDLLRFLVSKGVLGFTKDQEVIVGFSEK